MEKREKYFEDVVSKKLITEMLTDKVDDIFIRLQEELGIESGDVFPWEELDIDSNIKDLAKSIFLTLERQYYDGR